MLRQCIKGARQLTPLLFPVHGALGLIAWSALIASSGAALSAQGVFLQRDLDTGILGNEPYIVSMRYMRHVWVASDGSMATAVHKGGYEDQGLVLYTSINEVDWNLAASLASRPFVVSDGVLAANDDLLLVTSVVEEDSAVDVQFIRLAYETGTRTWSVDPTTPVTVFPSGALERATRATVAVDSFGVIWCAFRLENTLTGIFDLARVLQLRRGHDLERQWQRLRHAQWVPAEDRQGPARRRTDGPRLPGCQGAGPPQEQVQGMGLSRRCAAPIRRLDLRVHHADDRNGG